MPALDVNRIGDEVSRRSEVGQVMVLALSNVDRPAVLHRLKVEDESAERPRERLALSDDAAERIGPGFTTLCGSRTPWRLRWTWILARASRSQQRQHEQGYRE